MKNLPHGRDILGRTRPQEVVYKKNKKYNEKIKSLREIVTPLEITDKAYDTYLYLTSIYFNFHRVSDDKFQDIEELQNEIFPIDIFNATDRVKVVLHKRVHFIFDMNRSLNEHKDAICRSIIESVGGNKTHASILLNVSVKTLRKL